MLSSTSLMFSRELLSLAIKESMYLCSLTTPLSLTSYLSNSDTTRTAYASDTILASFSSTTMLGSVSRLIFSPDSASGLGLVLSNSEREERANLGIRPANDKQPFAQCSDKVTCS